MTGRGAVSANQLSREVGIGQPTLSRWKREATLPAVTKKKPMKSRRRKKPKATVPSSGKDVATRHPWTPEDKLRVVEEAAAVGDEGLGELLRREGLHEADLGRFRQELLSGLRGATVKSRKASPETKRIKELERELRRKERALAETAALLVLRKKAEAFFLGEEEGDTTEKSGK